jgi:DNA-directed RNA polymerase specialized sigma24 family protein
VSVDGLLTPRGFERLLDHLHPDRDIAGRTYEQLRRRLVRFFEGRRCAFPEEHADESLNRVARKLDAGETIQDVTTYVIGIARMVVKEVARAASKEVAAQAALGAPDYAQLSRTRRPSRPPGYWTVCMCAWISWRPTIAT